MAEVTKDNYALVTKGLLKSWLDDFFAEQLSATAYLVTVTTDLTLAVTGTQILWLKLSGYLKGLAYFKTVCITAPDSGDELLVPCSCC